ncbi:ABC transporter [Pyrenophora tritici-repentis]|nr:ABC transporter [Pyrenophora tritici-repentis]
MPAPPRIQVTGLTFTFPGYPTGVHSVTLDLPPRSRTLLIGANGSGKTTLLKLLSGTRLPPAGTIRICGVDPFQESLAGVTYLGLEWATNPIVRHDIGVMELLRSVGGNDYPERRDALVTMLDIDTNWRLHAVSDGERRRVQLAMGLLRPWTILFLDEITVDLDVLSRAEFLGWLKRETEERVCTVVYATHILDNLAGWPSHLVHMSLGSVKQWGETEKILQSYDSVVAQTGNSRLSEMAIGWLKKDVRERGPRNHTYNLST